MLGKRREKGSFQLSEFEATDREIAIDGAAFASLLAGIDFTASRRGWFRRGVSKGDRHRFSAVILERVTDDEGEKLLRENAELRAQVTKLVEQVAKLNDRVGELLAVAQRRHRTPSPDKPPPPLPVVEGDSRTAFDDRPKAPEKPARPEREKKPRRRQP